MRKISKLPFHRIWLIFYAVILTVFTAVSTVLFFTYKNNLNLQAQNLNSYVSETIVSNIESILTDMNNVYSGIVSNDGTNNVLRINNADEYHQNASAQNLVKSISAYTQLRTISDVYVYIEKTDTIICSSGIYPSLKYYNVYINDPSMPFDEWRKLNQNAGLLRQYVSIAPENSSQNRLFCISKARIIGADDLTIGVSTDKQNFFRTVGDYRWLESCSVYIIDRDVQYHFFSKNSNETDDNLKDKIVISKNISVSDTTGVTVSITTPKSLLMSNISYMNKLPFVFICILLLLTVVAGICVLSRNYGSIVPVFKKFSLDPMCDNYETLIRAIDKNSTDYQKLETAFSQKKEQLRYSVLSSIIKKGYDEKSDKLVLENHGIKFKFDFFAVIVFYVRDIKKLYNENFDRETRAIFVEMRYIMSNIFEELFSNKGYISYLTDVSNNFVAIVNTDKNDASVLHNLKDISEYGTKFLYEHFGVNLNFSVSALHSSLSKIDTAYGEAMHGINHILMHNLENGITSAEISEEKTNSSYLFSKKQAELLADFIKDGNSENSVFIINEIMDRLSNENEYNTNFVKLVFYDIAGCILKCSDKEVSSDMLDCMFSLQSISDMRNFLVKTAAKICSYAFSENGGQPKALGSEIIDYIHMNYQDPDLNIAAIGFHFNLTAAYISKVFKNEYGISLFDFIHKYRISKAKDLMSKSGNSIADIALAVGYAQIRTFNRIFKKYEGMTPSEFRTNPK